MARRQTVNWPTCIDVWPTSTCVIRSCTMAGSVSAFHHPVWLLSAALRIDAMSSPTVVDAVPHRLFSFRWHDYDFGSPLAPAEQPTSLVEFRLEPIPGGTRLTITESGFDQLPAERRAKAFADNSEGWRIQTTLIGKYLAQAA